jgi:hypothetical protein
MLTMGPHGETPGRVASNASTSEEVLKQKLFRVRGLYGRVLSEEDIQDFAAVEAEFPLWQLWPHIGWPDARVIYARRLNTGMRVIVESSTDEVRVRIKEWMSEHR